MVMQKKFSPPEYVGFGMLTHVSIMVLDRMPRRNTGAIVQQVNDFVFDDAAIVVSLQQTKLTRRTRFAWNH